MYHGERQEQGRTAPQGKYSPRLPLPRPLLLTALFTLKLDQTSFGAPAGGTSSWSGWNQQFADSSLMQQPLDLHHLRLVGFLPPQALPGKSLGQVDSPSPGFGLPSRPASACLFPQAPEVQFYIPQWALVTWNHPDKVS